MLERERITTIRDQMMMTTTMLYKKMSKKRRRQRQRDHQILSSLTSFVRIPSVLREKRPRGIVPPARFKNIQFISRPSVHVCRFYLRDVHA
jgi:hypothetical protein